MRKYLFYFAIYFSCAALYLSFMYELIKFNSFRLQFNRFFKGNIFHVNFRKCARCIERRWVSRRASGFKGILLLFLFLLFLLCSTNSYVLYQPTDRASRVIKFLMCLSWYSLPLFHPRFALSGDSSGQFNPLAERERDRRVTGNGEEGRTKQKTRKGERGREVERGICVLSVAINLWIVPNYTEALNQSS